MRPWLTLGVVLGTVLLTSGVESDDLVTQDVLSSSNGAWDSNRPSEVVIDELGGSPLSIFVTSRINLKKFQVGSLSRRSIVNLGHVIDYRANVTLRPGAPLDINGTSCSYFGDLSASGSILVASDLVHIGVHGGIDKTVVKALRARPLDYLRGRVLILERWVVGSVVRTIDLDGSNVAVSVDGRSNRTNNGRNLDLGRHVGSFIAERLCIREQRSRVSFEINEGKKECYPLQSMKGKWLKRMKC